MVRLTLVCAFLALLAWPAVAQQRLSGGTPTPPCSDPAAPQINTLSSIGGSLTNAYGVWTFGQGMTPPTGAGPPGPFSSFNFVKLNGKVINRIGQFGVGAVRTGASQIVLDCGGNIFFLTTENDRLWYQYVNYEIFGVDNNPFSGGPNPGGILASSVSSAPLPNYNPPYTPSPDSTTPKFTSAPGTATTLDGIWSNGSGGSTWQLLLNNVYAGAVMAGGPPHLFTSLVINCNGNVFVKDSVNGNWFAALSLNAYDVGSGTLPTCPIPTVVTVTPNPALVTAPAPGPQMTAGTSGTIASVAVTTSSGSFTGTLSINANPAAPFLSVSGLNIVATSAVSGTYNVEIHAIQGGLEAWPGASTIELSVH